MLKNKLREIRMKEHMLTQKEFSQLLEIPNYQYNRYEKEKICPPLEVAITISYKLNRTVNEIWYISE